MFDSDSLDSVLGNEESAAGNLPLETPTDETPGDEIDTDAPPAPEAQPTAKPEGEKPAAEPEEAWTKQAVLDERRKRQALEREIAELRGKQSPSSPAHEKPERPDIFVDQEGFIRSIEQALRAERINEKIVESQEDMREQFDDYDEKEQLFVGFANENPALIQKMLRHRNPAKFVYQEAQKHLQMQEFKDPEAYKQKIRAEVLAELETERAEGDDKPATKDSTGPSLIKQRSAGRNPVVNESLEDILGR